LYRKFLLLLKKIKYVAEKTVEDVLTVILEKA